MNSNFASRSMLCLLTNALYFYYTQEPPAGLFAANCRGFLDPHNPSPFACSKSWRTRPTRPHVLPAVVRLPLPSLLLVLLHQQRRVEAVSLQNNQTQGDGDVWCRGGVVWGRSVVGEEQCGGGAEGGVLRGVLQGGGALWGGGVLRGGEEVWPPGGTGKSTQPVTSTSYSLALR